MRRLERLRPGIQAIVDRQVDEIAAAGERGDTVDLVPTFAFPIPFLVICDLLGPARREARDVQQARHRPLRRDRGRSGTVGAIGGSREFLLAEAARQRQQPRPRADRPDHPRPR